MFSKEYNELITSPKKFANIMRYNESSPVYEEWEEKRRFIADLIESDGTILDIGCAGGLFLKSIQEWCGHNLEPYGIDIDEDYIAAAKKLFPLKKDNFAILDVKKIENINKLGLPKDYDYVFWNFLGPKRFKDPNLLSTVEKIIKLANKRVIIGFYGNNDPDATTAERNAEHELLGNRIENFKKDFRVSGTLFNPTKFNQAVVWIDKKINS